MSQTDLELAHFGVRGMRWGVRNSSSSVSKGKAAAKKALGPSEEGKAALKLKKQAQRKGVITLSNAELQTLNNRLNLEQQYSQWSAKNPSLSQKARTFASEMVLEYGKQQTVTLGGRDSQQQVAQLVREAVTGSKSSQKRRADVSTSFVTPPNASSPKHRRQVMNPVPQSKKKKK